MCLCRQVAKATKEAAWGFGVSRFGDASWRSRDRHRGSGSVLRADASQADPLEPV